ncbi:MAG: hypothetical protein ACTSXL_04865 [Alphaproteobacteria bacterium]|nr:MAG: hypothetical protein B6I23_00320 [Rickettsiaceae bacterium 4572_127]
MIKKSYVIFSWATTLFLFFLVFFIQFSIREKKDLFNRQNKEIEKMHDKKQSLKVKFSILTNQKNLQKLEKELFPNRANLAGQI